MDSSDTVAKKPQGHPLNVDGIQRRKFIELYGETWVDIGEGSSGKPRSEKSGLLDRATVYALAKYGVLDPWRRLDVDVAEPKELKGVAGGKGDLTDEQFEKKRLQIRSVSS